MARQPRTAERAAHALVELVAVAGARYTLDLDGISLGDLGIRPSRIPIP